MGKNAEIIKIPVQTVLNSDDDTNYYNKRFNIVARSHQSAVCSGIAIDYKSSSANKKSVTVSKFKWESGGLHSQIDGFFLENRSTSGDINSEQGSFTGSASIGVKSLHVDDECTKTAPFLSSHGAKFVTVIWSPEKKCIKGEGGFSEKSMWLDPGDVVLQINERVWDALLKQYEKKGSKNEIFKALFSNFNEDTLAYKYVEAIATRSAAAVLRDEDEAALLMSDEKIISAVKEYNTRLSGNIFSRNKNYTIKQWINDNNLSDKRQSIIAEAKKFDLTEDSDVSKFIWPLQEKVRNNIVTVSAVIVPSPDVERYRLFFSDTNAAESLVKSVYEDIDSTKPYKDQPGEKILKKLATEEQINAKDDEEMGVKPEEVQFVKSYSESTIDSWRHRLTAMYFLSGCLDKARENKNVKAAAVVMSALQSSDAPILDISTINDFYIILKNDAEVRAHRNPWVDSFFGKDITKTWSQLIEELRKLAMEKLRALCDQNIEIDDKRALLESVRQLPVITEPCRNYSTSGQTNVLKETDAVKEIDNMIAVLQPSSKVGPQL